MAIAPFSSVPVLISSLFVTAGLAFAAQPGCQSCHAEIVRSFATTGMGQSVGRPASAQASVRHHVSASVLSVDGKQHRVERAGLSAQYPVVLRIGSGKVGSSFAVAVGETLFQSPVSWYAQAQEFRMSPGYEQEKYPDFDRRIRAECLYCHTNGTGTPVSAIGRERCHGDGGAHSAKPSRTNIVNPARLEGARRDNVCEQCHLPGAVRIFNRGKRAGNYQPGQVLEDTWTTFVSDGGFRVASHVEQFVKSACLKADRLWCGTCHNPHPTTARPARLVDSVCRDCHEPHDAGKVKCASCHMPKRDVRDVVHAAYTDHGIQRPGSEDPVAEVRLRPWRTASPRNRALAVLEWAATQRDETLMAEASRQLLALRGSAEDDPQVLAARGAIALYKNNATEAVAWLEKAVKLESTNPDLHLTLGRAEQAAGNVDAALRHLDDAVRLDPLIFDAYVLAAQVHRSRGDWDAYRRVLTDYLRRVPQSLAARQALARARPER